MPPASLPDVSCRGRLAALACLALVGPPAAAVERIALDVPELSGQGWRANAVRAELAIGDQGTVLQFSLSALQGAGDQPLVADLRFRCPDPIVNAEYIACRSGTAGFTLPPASERIETGVTVVYRRADGRWRAQGDAALGGGVGWQVTGAGSRLEIEFGARDLAVSALSPWMPRLPGPVASVSGRAGRLDGRVVLPETGPATVSVALRGDGLGFDSADGSLAAAGVGLDAELDWRATDGGWRGEGSASVDGGEFLFGTFYTRIEQPLELAGSVDADGTTWSIRDVTLDHPDVARMAGSATWDWQADKPLRVLDLEFDSVRFPGFYDAYLQPLLAQYGFGELSVQGSLDGSLRFRDGVPTALDLAVEHLDVDDGPGRLQLTDLNGDIAWRDSGDPRASNLTWVDGRIYSVALGSADIRLASVGDSVRLTRQTVLPVLDGSLVINALEVDDWLGEEARLRFDARVLPISLGALSAALGWPELSGTLAGRIPELTYENGIYRLGGSLVVDVFDGSVLVENLRLERPFGVLPKMVADIELSDLDLEQLTGTFTFGRIVGRIAGYVRNLRLLDWQPVHFDASLATPENDDSPHRISQRAVDTLSSLGGGGAGGALSRTFLRVFDDFAYQRLGINCRLEDNVCRMGGVAPAPNDGYYIVEGGGLPRVDVIGYVRRVDWPVLVDQLIKATQGQTPTVGRDDDS